MSSSFNFDQGISQTLITVRLGVTKELGQKVRDEIQANWSLTRSLQSHTAPTSRISVGRWAHGTTDVSGESETVLHISSQQKAREIGSELELSDIHNTTDEQKWERA